MNAVYGCSCCAGNVCEKGDDQAGAIAQTGITNAPDLVPATIATTFGVAIGGSTDVSIDTLGDHDWYSVSLVAGQRYIFTTQVISGSNPDSFLNLRDSAGVLITSDDDGGDNTYSLIAYTATSTGTFYIDAGTYNDTSIGTYHLSAISVPAVGADSVAGSTVTTGMIALNGGIAGNIETANDHDFYGITLTAGQTYIFRTGGVVADGTVDTTLTLRDAAGTQLLTNDDAGEGAYSAVRFTATTTGTYYLDVGAFGSTTGQYTLTAFTTPPLSVYTNDQIATQLTNGYWGGSSHHFNVAPGGTLTVTIAALPAAAQNLAREALNLWTDATGIVFSEVATGGAITFQDTDTGAFASAVYPGGITTSATVNVGTAWLTTYGTGLNSYSFQTYVHEIGHALGLGHGGNYNGSASYASDALYANDSWATTVMSYFDQNENTYFAELGLTRQFAVTPMVADGIAITALYGTNTLTRTGNTTYGFNNSSGRAIYDATANPSVSYTIFDNGGTDTLDYSGFAQNQRINLIEESFSNIGARVGNVSIARGAVIENAIGGSGNDIITGNAANNVLTGGGGNDLIEGGAGQDRALYNGASGAVFADLAGRFVLETGLQTGTVLASTGLLSTDAISNFEDFTGSAYGDRIYGTDTANNIESGNGNDIVYAEGGDDVVVGGGGADILLGGSGFDTLNYAAAVGAIYADLAGFAIETGLQSGTVTGGTTANSTDLLAQFENLIGSAYGDRLYGDANANTIIAGDGDDIIYGGAGSDVLTGGGGNDRIISEAGADMLTGGTGTDSFFFTAALTSGVDSVTDFVAGSDSLWLLASVFGVASGSTAQLVVNGTASAAGTFLYNNATGVLSFDSDGAAGAAAIDFANIGVGIALTTADIVLYG